jgi:hypothetical protein
MTIHNDSRDPTPVYSPRKDHKNEPYRQLAGAVLYSGCKALKAAININDKKTIKQETDFLLTNSCFHQLLDLTPDTYSTMIKLIEDEDDWMDISRDKQLKGRRRR